MLGYNQQHLIIVCDDATVKYANYLRQLICSNNDKEGEIVGTEDGSIGVIVYTEQQYKDNMPTISSNEHILFIGNHNAAKAERSTMNIKYSGFGCKYSWLGKRGCLCVTDDIKSRETYDDFFTECKKYEDFIKTEKQAPALAMRVGSEPGEGAVLALLALLDPVTAATLGVGLLKEQAKIRDQQYRFLIVKFYLEDLAVFLEA